MVVKIARWGNSQGLRLSKQVLEDACVSVGDEVNIAVREGLIVVEPLKRARGKTSLRSLVARIPKNYRPQETGWGKPVGREVW